MKNTYKSITHVSIILSLMFFILMASSFSPLLDSSNTSDLNPEGQSPYSYALPKDISIDDTIPSSIEMGQTRGDSIDFELTGIQVIGNITLSSFSRMIIRDADVTVNGIITITDYGALFIMNSTVVINPPEIDENTSVISITDLGSIRIYDSNFTVNPCPNPTAVPFISTEGDSTVIIQDSDFTSVLPAIPEMITKIEGSLVASGNSKWIVTNSNVYAIANESGGWFWYGLVGGTLDIFNSMFYTESHMVDLFAHSFGTMRIVDSTIIGRTMYEGTSVGEIINSSLIPEPGGFTSLGIIDSTQCTIINSSFSGLVGLNDKCVVEVHNSTFDENRGIRVAKNASLTLIDCHIPPHCDLLENATLDVFSSSDIEVHITDLWRNDIYSNCTVSLTDSSIEKLGVNAKDNVFIHSKSSKIETISTDGFVGIFGDIDGTTINNLSLGSDNVINLTLTDASEIVNLVSNKNCTFNMTLIDDSIIESIERDEDEYLITTIDSPTPDISLEDVTILIKHRLYVPTKLNGNDISTIVDVFTDEEQVVSGQSEDGSCTFILLYQEVDETGTYTIGEYTVSSSYFGLEITKGVTLDRSKELEIYFQDYAPPVISNFRYEKRLWNLENKVTNSMWVEVHVTDEDIKEVLSVTIRYSSDEGATWHEIPMTGLEDNMYEGVIPEHSAGENIRFTVVANDIAYNSDSTTMITYQEGVGNLLILWSIIILLCALFIIAVVIKISRFRKERRYIGGKPSISKGQLIKTQ